MAELGSFGASFMIVKALTAGGFLPRNTDFSFLSGVGFGFRLGIIIPFD
jgi:hypothetical protein